MHAVGGFIGNICTGLFAADYIAHLDGTTEIDGGFLNQNYRQLGIQLADSLACMTYSFFGTCIILGIMNFLGRFVPALALRVSRIEEQAGIDDVEIGEYAYDYVELMREVKPPGVEQDDYEMDASSQRSHSQAFMRPDKGYPLQTLHSGPHAA